MTFLSRAISRTPSIQRAAFQGDQPLTSSSILEALKGNGDGANATQQEAITIATVNRAASIVAGTVARSRKEIVNSAGKPMKKTSTWVTQPHSFLSEFHFFELAMMHLMFHGNFYAVIDRSAKTLTPMDPQSIKVKAVVNGTRWIDTIYETDLQDGKGNTTQVGIPSDDMLHIVGMGFDGLVGHSLIQSGAKVFSNALKTDDYAEKFYGSGSLMSGVLTTDKRLDEKTAEALKQRWRSKVQGIENAFDVVVLDSGTSFHPVTVSPRDAQFLDARRFNVEEIGRLFGVHPSLLGETSAASATPESAAIDLVTFTIDAWNARISSGFKQAAILGPTNSLVLHADGIITPDERTRSSAAVMWRTAQVKSINEIRAVDGLGPIDNPDADDPMFSIEPQSADTPGENQGQAPKPEPDPNAGTDPS